MGQRLVPKLIGASERKPLSQWAVGSNNTKSMVLFNLAHLGHRRTIYSAAVNNVQSNCKDDNGSEDKDRPIHIHQGRVIGGWEEGEDDGEAKPSQREDINW